MRRAAQYQEPEWVRASEAAAQDDDDEYETEVRVGRCVCAGVGERGVSGGGSLGAVVTLCVVRPASVAAYVVFTSMCAGVEVVSETQREVRLKQR